MTLNSKSEILNPKQIPDSQIPNPKQYDLEERTYLFTKIIVGYVNRLPETIPNIETGKQLVKSSGSVGVNYIEANESLSKKDFCLRIKICKKEAKESRYWLRLTQPKKEDERERTSLIEQAFELTKIFGSILEKSK